MTAPLALLVAAAVVALGANAGPLVAVGHAATVRCGTVVGEQATLDRDLHCDGAALILRNPRTVLQLNGHTLESHRSCSEGAAVAGIVVESTAHGAQIFGPGAIRGFIRGIQITGASRVQVRDVRVSDSCTDGLLVIGADDVHAHGVTLHRNGATGDGGTAVHVEQAERFALEASEVFLNGTGAAGAAVVDLRACDHCRIVENRIVANRGVGLRMDVDSHAGTIERNLILDHHPNDIADEGNDSTVALNVFERGDGVAPPSLWPLTGQPSRGAPGVAGCGTMTDFIKPRQTVTITCPQDPGLRALRNSVVAYRLLVGDRLYGAACAHAELRPAYSGGGGGVTCTSPDSIWGLVLEVTCCLN